MFDLDVVNAFTVGAVVVLKNYCATGVKQGDVKMRKISSTTKGVSVFVNITGDLTGKLLFNMNKKTALKLASILNSEEITTTNNIFAATLKEFVNLVAGHAINTLSTKHIDLDMTPPSIIISEGMSIIEPAETKILAIDYQTDIGQITLNLMFDD